MTSSKRTQPSDEQDMVSLRKELLELAVEAALEIHERPTIDHLDTLVTAFETYVTTGAFPTRTTKSALKELSQYTRANLDKAQVRLSDYRAKITNGTETKHKTANEGLRIQIKDANEKP